MSPVDEATYIALFSYEVLIVVSASRDSLFPSLFRFPPPEWYIVTAVYWYRAFVKVPRIQGKHASSCAGRVQDLLLRTLDLQASPSSTLPFQRSIRHRLRGSF